MPKIAQSQSLFNPWTKYNSMYKVLKNYLYLQSLLLFIPSFYSQHQNTSQVFTYVFIPISYWAKLIKHFTFLSFPFKSPPKQKQTASPSSSSLLVFQPHFFYSHFLLSPYTPVMKETHHHVLTRTRTERESDAEFQMHLFSPPSPGSHWHPQS